MKLFYFGLTSCLWFTVSDSHTQVSHRIQVRVLRIAPLLNTQTCLLIHGIVTGGKPGGSSLWRGGTAVELRFDPLTRTGEIGRWLDFADLPLAMRWQLGDSWRALIPGKIQAAVEALRNHRLSRF